jgi:hypothetical protein
MARLKRGRPPKSETLAVTEVQQKALQIYAHAYARKSLTAARVAARLNVSRQAVAKWLKDPVWDERLSTEITELWTEELTARLKIRDERVRAELREARRFRPITE